MDVCKVFYAGLSFAHLHSLPHAPTWLMMLSSSLRSILPRKVLLQCFLLQEESLTVGMNYYPWSLSFLIAYRQFAVHFIIWRYTAIVGKNTVHADHISDSTNHQARTSPAMHLSKD